MIKKKIFYWKKKEKQMDEQFFLDQIEKFKNKELVNHEMENELYNILLRDLSQVSPNELGYVHKTLAKEAEEYFSKQEEFQKAKKLKEYQQLIDEIKSVKKRIHEINSQIKKE